MCHEPTHTTPSHPIPKRDENGPPIPSPQSPLSPSYNQIDRSGRFPMVRFANRDSYAKSKTKEYDEIAAKYLSYALYPLVIGYAVYSLTYSTHKSWYSWLLSSLTGCVYTFGEEGMGGWGAGMAGCLWGRWHDGGVGMGGIS